MSPDDPRHGTNAGWNAHYSTGTLPACDPCRRASNLYTKALRLEHLAGRPRRMPALGARRRVQALARIGWPAREVAARLGISQQVLSESIHPTRRHVYRARYEAIAAVYEALSGTRGPSDRVAVIAENKGWPAPLAWDNIDDPEELPRGVRLCALRGCARPSKAHGLCGPCYQRARRAAA